MREIARFQSFEDNFKFLGDSVREKYKMIGNSVPPKLSFELARDIKDQLFWINQSIAFLVIFTLSSNLPIPVLQLSHK